MREFADQQQRYEAVSKHLTTVKLPYIVGFHFLSRGIKIRGQWYPILKMEWVQGELLNEYIKKNLRNSSTLLNLANRWITMVKALQQATIAHGDLQHANVMVVNGDFRLIDYDGMFVPALAGQSSHEVGHRNYQHPFRTESDFGPYLDHFAAWVIYVSLISLSIDPGLWHRIGAGDEFLLFHKEDFDEPSTSSTFMLLARHADARIQSLTSVFRSLVYLGPQQAPNLDGQSAVSATPGTRSISGGADWVKDHVCQEQTKTAAVSSVSGGEVSNALLSENSTWVLDFISPSQSQSLKSFSSSVIFPRLLAALPLALISVLFASGFFPIALPIYFAFSVTAILLFLEGLLLVSLYRRESVVVEKRTILARAREERRRLASVEQMRKENEKKKVSLRTEENKRRSALAKQKSALQEEERHEQDNAQAQLTKTLGSINAHRRVLNQEEAEALTKVQAEIGSEIAALNRQVSALAQAESDEVSNALQTVQSEFVRDYLQRYRIADASISGIGSGFKSRLRSYGFVTAADVKYGNVQRVQGIGPSRASAIHAWQRSLEGAAKSKMPRFLSPSEKDKIKSKYETQKRQLESRRDDEQRRLSAEESALRDRYRTARRPLGVEESTAQARATRELQEIANRYAQEYTSISQALEQLAAELLEKSRKIDESTEQIRKQLFDCNWQLAKTRRELVAFKNISFGKYMRSAFFRHRVT